MSQLVANILAARSYEEIVENDLELIWWVKRFCQLHPWIENTMNRIVSKHPMQDICLVLWIVFIIGWIEVGHSHFWVCAMNITVVLLARRLIEAKRPVEYDRRLRPKTEINPESYGFPSVESHMVVVIFGHLYLSYLSHHPSAQHKRFAFFASSTFSAASSTTATDSSSNETNWLLTILQPLFSSYIVSTFLFILAIVMSGVVGFSRIYSASRFPHQIAASYITGLVGLLLSRHCCEHMAFHKMRDFEHYSCMIFILIGIFANVALSMENNDSRLLNIPKKEFMRVICDILSSSKTGDAVLADSLDENSDAQGMNDMGDDNTAEGARRRNMLTPRAIALREAQDRRTRQNLRGNGFSSQKRRYVKSDSLYFLQRSMEERERKQQAELQAAVLGNQESGKKGREYGNEDFYSSDNDAPTPRFTKRYNQTNMSKTSSSSSSMRNRFQIPDI